MRCVAAEPPTSSAKTTSCPPSTPPSRSSDRGDLCRAAVVEHRAASRQPPAASLGPDDRPRVTQTDGISKDVCNADEMFWLAPDGVPTLGDWFRAAGYRTFLKGKWHASHAHL